MSGSILHRIATFDGPVVRFTLDGKAAVARQGESVLAAILSQGAHLRRHEANAEPRAGFCLMGACQDCWVWVGPGRRARACSTSIAEAMQISTAPAGSVSTDD